MAKATPAALATFDLVALATSAALALDTAQVAALSTEQVAAITTSDTGALATADISVLSTNAVASLVLDISTIGAEAVQKVIDDHMEEVSKPGLVDDLLAESRLALAAGEHAAHADLEWTIAHLHTLKLRVEQGFSLPSTLLTRIQALL